jgi:hypothetical protein
MELSSLLNQRTIINLNNIKGQALRKEFNPIIFEDADQRPQLTVRVHGRKRALNVQVVA